MKTLELKPTHENIMNAFERNPIGRNGDVFMFADILNSIDSNCSISLDGGWGRGKTFFVKQAKVFLDSQNDFVKSISADDKELIVSEWKSLHKGKERNIWRRCQFIMMLGKMTTTKTLYFL